MFQQKLRVWTPEIQQAHNEQRMARGGDPGGAGKRGKRTQEMKQWEMNPIAGAVKRGADYASNLLDQGPSVRDVTSNLVGAIPFVGPDLRKAMEGSTTTVPVGLNMASNMPEEGYQYGEPAKYKKAGIETYKMPTTDLLDAMKVSDLTGTSGLSRAAESVGYGEAPDVMDLLDAAQVGGGLYGAAKLGAKGAKMAGKGALKALEQAGTGPRSGSMAAQRGIIKMPGGNWLDDSVKKELKSFKTQTVAGQTPAERIPLHEKALEDVGLNDEGRATIQRHLDRTKGDAAIDNWVDRNLTNYVKKQMATSDDPVRKLAEQGVVHMPIQNTAAWNYEVPRKKAGYPIEGVGVSPEAKSWEQLADSIIYSDKAKSLIDPNEIKDIIPELRNDQAYLNLQKNPWLSKVDPETDVYRLGGSGLGFDHIIDVLRQDVSEGRIRPDQLNKVSMEQAVRRTYEYDQEMAKRMRETQAKVTEGMPVHKEYPEGYKWIELKKPDLPDVLPEGWSTPVAKGNTLVTESPDGKRVLGNNIPDLVKNIYRRHPETPGNPDTALEKALKYEGDTMGHCVGSYCDNVSQGISRIYSLRDAKGEPHVTIEVKPNQDHAGFRYAKENYPELYAQYAANKDKYFNSWRDFLKQEAPEVLENVQKNITQIFGKGNAAPKEEYLPFVQDFVKSGEWSGLNPRELRNAGLRDIEKTPKVKEYLNKKGVDAPRYLTEDEYQGHESDFLMDQLYPKNEPPVEGMKAGGEVHMSIGGDMVKAVKAAKTAKAVAEAKEKIQHPLIFPRAAAKTKEDIRPIAQRIAEQMTGDFVRQDPKVTTNPAGKSRKQWSREQEIPLETRSLIPESEVPAIDYETKLGHALVGVPGDPTLGSVVRKGTLESAAQPSVELTRVGDVVPEHPVPLFGGPRYGNDERFWASNLGQASPVQNRVNKLSEEHQAPVLGQYIKMAPDSANFAMHNLDSLLAIQQPERLPKSKLEELNKLIREGSKRYGKFPNFVGFQDPMDVLLSSQFDSKLRKHIAETLTKPTITNDLGLVNGLDVVAAITHPQLRNMETGISGFSIGEMRPGSNLRESLSEHPTYDTDIPGALIGQSKYPTPYEIAFPDTTAYTRNNLEPGVQEFNMLKMLGPRERIDQQYIDEMKMYEELMKEYTGKKKGGLAQAKKPKKVARHGNTVSN